MARNVNIAFEEFFENIINIPKATSETAKKSMNYLFEQIHLLSKNGFFIKLISQYDVSFGSFARKTKINPLDDIDIIIGLDGNKTIYSEYSWNNITMKCGDDCNNKLLKDICEKKINYYNTEYVINSTKIKNALISALREIYQYNKAELHARGEAVTLKLNSYSWTFDIVHAFFCSQDNKDYYLIPNGNGAWKKTNPKIEQKRLSDLNVKFNGVVIKLIRLVKYWNRRGKMPNITSYVLETMVLDYFDTSSHSAEQENKTYDYVDIHFKNFLDYLSKNIFNVVKDSKNIEGDINNLTNEQKQSLYNRAKNDYKKAYNAVYAEVYEKNMAKSINLWRDLFGEEFPCYE